MAEFPLERILTIGIGDLAESTGMRHKLLDFYLPVGVHAVANFGFNRGDVISPKAFLSQFAERVPQKAVVVVDFKFSSAVAGELRDRYIAQMSGTALVPKDDRAAPLDKYFKK